MPHKPGNGAIFGIVSEDGASKPDFPVTLLDRTNGNIVNRRYTDLNGGFVFAGLNPETDDYQVIAQDEDNPPFKNAIIRDRIQPVPGYQGATYYGNWRLKSAEFNTIAFYDGTTINDPDPGYGIKIISPYPSNNHPVLLEGVSGSSKAEIQPALNASITPGDPSIPYSISIMANFMFDLDKVRLNLAQSCMASSKLRQSNHLSLLPTFPHLRALILRKLASGFPDAFTMKQVLC